jgi:hypothetical protein
VAEVVVAGEVVLVVDHNCTSARRRKLTSVDNEGTAFYKLNCMSDRPGMGYPMPYAPN